MKTSKSPESAETTPSKKKLKQARLPFKILSDVSPTPVAIQPRKRKLSAPEPETIPKPSKIYKENGHIEETLVISDDDSKDEVSTDKDVKIPNPYVKLVDTARKKKLQKSKKKKNDKKKTFKTDNSSCDVQTNSDTKELGDEMMDVDETPEREVQKKPESAKMKEERDKKRQQEKEERAKQKQEKEEQKKREREEKEEAKKKEKEEKEEQRRKEKEEKEKQKELEKKQREEKEEQKRKEREEKEEQKKKEKEEREEQKRKEKEAREEEKRKKQEALELEKQEQEMKKKKAAAAFVNFFVPKQKADKDQATICSVSNSMLTNFTIKNDMRLAPLVRVNLSENQKQHLDKSLLQQAENILYLKALKDGVSKPLASGKTWPLSDKDDDDNDDVMIVEDAELPPIDGAGEILSSQSVPCEKLRAKLFSFHENRRPPYWGTWRKKSASITPRKPFAQDQKQLDYEVDSDDEWEEEQEGESLDGSAAGSDDEQDGDEYEVDNVVFVPHGYLSDEEATMDEDDVLSLSPETQQARLKHLEDEFESEMKKPTEKLKPRMYGLLWETSEGGKPDKCVDTLWNYFRKMSMIMNDPTPLLQPSSEPEENEKKKVKKKKQATQPEGEKKQKSPKSEKKKKNKTDDKEIKTPKSDTKKNSNDVKKNQPGINMFLTKVKSS